ncbi:MAG TPA: TetR/AcrR family transcriptional regulator [Pseudonocardiaceae bacterium]
MTTTPVHTRRRGAELEAALHTATLAELTAVGYGRLTMEGVAARARTGKAAVYRRWPTKHELVLAALRYAMPPVPDIDPDRPARDNLLAVFTTLRDVLAGRTAFPSITIFGELLREPTLRTMFTEAIVAPRLRVIESILRRAERNAEIAPDTLTPLAALVGPALIMQTFLLTGNPPTRRELIRIIETVLPQPS